MPSNNKIKPTRPLGSSSKGGFVRFMRSLDNPEAIASLEGKELKDDTTDLLLASERLGRELYQRYEKLLEWIAGECNWRDYLNWVGDRLSDSERQACMSLRNSLGIHQYTTDSMGMYNGDRSGTLGKAVERILSDHQGEQQDAVSPGASAAEQYYRTQNLDLERLQRLREFTFGPSSDPSRSG